MIKPSNAARQRTRILSTPHHTTQVAPMASGNAVRLEAPSFRGDGGLVHLDESPAGWVASAVATAELPKWNTARWRRRLRRRTDRHRLHLYGGVRNPSHGTIINAVATVGDSFGIDLRSPWASLRRSVLAQESDPGRIRSRCGICTSASEMTGPAGAPRYRKSASLNEIAAFLRIGPRK